MFEKSPLEKFVEKGEFEMAKEYIKRQRNVDSDEAEHMIFDVLRGENPERVPQDLVDLVLQVFMDSYSERNHRYWVHSLSHFTGKLWELGQFEWIKKFYLVAFQGTIKTKEANCSGRLVNDFARYAKWDQKPEDFHLTAENLIWVDWEYSDIGDLGEARMAAGNFASEAEYLKWKEKFADYFPQPTE
jgi:hypothetical protein